MRNNNIGKCNRIIITAKIDMTIIAGIRLHQVSHEWQKNYDY